MFFDCIFVRGGVRLNGLLENIRPVYQGPLMELPPVKVAQGQALGTGIYNIWFVVDYPMDVVLHLTPGRHMLSRVTLVVE
ncbi:MAG: hypothetical protein LC725_05645 [Lentisphaerae bacterium]|nr:hypothetical protein [Lentisphaerota bacterium]